MGKKLTTESFIEKANKIHDNKYIYTKTNVIDSKTKVCVICPEHGEFWITPSKHLIGQGCRECAKIKRRDKQVNTLDYFKIKSNEKYNGRYILDKVKYVNSKTKVCVICPEHGEFWITPNNFLRGHGCPKCKAEKISQLKHYSGDIFTEKARVIHGNDYDYSKIDYQDSATKIKIIHKKCGHEFFQTPREHLMGRGCPFCGGTKKLTSDDFVNKSRIIHGDDIDYSKVSYKNNSTKVELKCNKCGNIFFQTPRDHLTGHGCPNCNRSKLERQIEYFLKEENIKYESQKHFEWLGKQSLDFYLPDYNIAIECQGEQHFKPIKYFGGNETLNMNVRRDELKSQLCIKNNIKLLYYITNVIKDDFYNQIYTTNNTFFDKESLLNGITRYLLL